MLLRSRFLVALASVALFCGCAASTRQMNTLRTDPDPQKRAAAATALGSVTSEAKQAAVAEALADATVDPDPAVRQAAVESLAKIGGDTARQALINVVQGKQFATAALDHYETAEQLGARTPEVLQSLAQAQLEAGKLQEAKQTFDDLHEKVKLMEPQQQAQYLYGLQFGYQRLAGELTGKDQADLAKEVETSLQDVGTAISAAEAAGPPGGMGGFQDLGGLGGIPITP